MGHHPMGEGIDPNPRIIAEKLVDQSARSWDRLQRTFMIASHTSPRSGRCFRGAQPATSAACV